MSNKNSSKEFEWYNGFKKMRLNNRLYSIHKRNTSVDQKETQSIIL